MLLAAFFVIIKRWKQPKCPSTGKRTNKTRAIHTIKCYSALKKEEKSDTCYNMDEPEEYYAM